MAKLTSGLGFRYVIIRVLDQEIKMNSETLAKISTKKQAGGKKQTLLLTTARSHRRPCFARQNQGFRA